jgi:hypothetical protein
MSILAPREPLGSAPAGAVPKGRLNFLSALTSDDGGILGNGFRGDQTIQTCHQ